MLYTHSQILDCAAGKEEGLIFGYSREESVKNLEWYLFHFNVDINKLKDATGNSALHLAIMNQSFEHAQVLLRCGARLDNKNNAGESCLELIVKLDLEKARYLEEANTYKARLNEVTTLLDNLKMLIESKNSDSKESLETRISTHLDKISQIKQTIRNSLHAKNFKIPRVTQLQILKACKSEEIKRAEKVLASKKQETIALGLESILQKLDPARIDSKDLKAEINSLSNVEKDVKTLAVPKELSETAVEVDHKIKNVYQQLLKSAIEQIDELQKLTESQKKMLAIKSAAVENLSQSVTGESAEKKHYAETLTTAQTFIKKHTLKNNTERTKLLEEVRFKLENLINNLNHEKVHGTGASLPLLKQSYDAVHKALNDNVITFVTKLARESVEESELTKIDSTLTAAVSALKSASLKLAFLLNELSELTGLAYPMYSDFKIETSSNLHQDAINGDKKSLKLKIWGVEKRTNILGIKVVPDHKALEKVKADPNSKDSNDRTPFMLAIANGQDKIATHLVKECKADINAKDKDGRTALMLASLNCQTSGVEYLFKNHFSEKVIKDWIQDAYKEFKEKGPKANLSEIYKKHNLLNINLKSTMDGANAFMYSIFKNDLKTATVYFEGIERFNRLLRDAQKSVSASEANQVQIIKGFQKNRFKFNAKDALGRTVMHIACAFGSVELLNSLFYFFEKLKTYMTHNGIAFDTDKLTKTSNFKDKKGLTPLMVAAKAAKVDIVTALIKRKSSWCLDVNAVYAPLNFTALDISKVLRKIINQAPKLSKSEADAKQRHDDLELELNSEKTGGISMIDKQQGNKISFVDLINDYKKGQFFSHEEKDHKHIEDSSGNPLCHEPPAFHANTALTIMDIAPPPALPPVPPLFVNTPVLPPVGTLFAKPVVTPPTTVTVAVATVTTALPREI